MPWLQLQINTQPSAVSSLEDALLTAGAVSVTFQENIPEGKQEQPILEPPLNETPLWQNTRLTALFASEADTQQVGEHLASVLTDLPPLSWSPLEDKDWEREWMANYQPIQVAQNLWVCPSWCEPPEPDVATISLDPGLAFGTGTHPTTFLCMRWLASQNLKQKTLIDYGCGSGILGIAALLLGAEQVTGVDIDPQALIATRENLKRNGLHADLFPVHFPQHDLPQVDIVVANILAGPLVELAPVISSLVKPGGLLCLSGLLSSQVEPIKSAYLDSISFTEIEAKEEWVCMVGKKNV